MLYVMQSNIYSQKMVRSINHPFIYFIKNSAYYEILHKQITVFIGLLDLMSNKVSFFLRFLSPLITFREYQVFLSVLVGQQMSQNSSRHQTELSFSQPIWQFLQRRFDIFWRFLKKARLLIHTTIDNRYFLSSRPTVPSKYQVDAKNVPKFQNVTYDYQNTFSLLLRD